MLWLAAGRFARLRVVKCLNQAPRVVIGKKRETKREGKLFTQTGRHSLHCMPQRVADIRNRIAPMVIQHRASGTHPAAGADGRAKPMRKQRAARGFIKGGIKVAVEIVAEGVTLG